MSEKIRSIRGMNDILPQDIDLWQFVENTFARILNSYGYSEIRTPIVESTRLFKRSIGEVTDIVEKEMYTFTDRNGDSLSLRPENTASIVRALIQHGMLQNRQKLWYRGPMFRHERPQKGRYRQFHQLGCEAFGMQAPTIDAELMAIGSRLWQKLGIGKVELQINSLGSLAARNDYKKVLHDYLSDNIAQLDEDSKRRLATNPLRILDSKNPDMQDLIISAPKLSDNLDTESSEHFSGLCQILEAMNIDYNVNPRLVRGLDYYGKTVFEWVTDELGAQGTICAGGRYDSMVEHIGGKFATPAVGFALGLERLLELVKINNSSPGPKAPDIYLVLVGEQARIAGLKLQEKLHELRDSLTIIANHDDGSFKTQFKRADKIGARFALILGEDEITKGIIGLKDLINNQQLADIKISKLADWLKTI